MLIPMLDETFELAARAGAREALIGMAHRGRLNVQAHAVGRPYREILAEFEGEKDIDVETAQAARRHRGRQVPPGRAGHLQHAVGQGADGDARAQPEPPRVRGPGRRGRTRADQTDRGGPRGEARPERRAADPDPRRRGLPRRGRRGRDAQPRGARGLLDRRHDPHHRQQPDRLHDRAARSRARRATPPTSRRASTSRSSTSTPTTPRPASRPCGSRWRTARSSGAAS